MEGVERVGSEDMVLLPDAPEKGACRQRAGERSIVFLKSIVQCCRWARR